MLYLRGGGGGLENCQVSILPKFLNKTNQSEIHKNMNMLLAETQTGVKSFTLT